MPLTNNYTVLMGVMRFSRLGIPPYLPHMAITRLRPAQITALHKHDFYEFFLVLDGSGVHHINHKREKLEKGHLVVIQPDDCHFFSVDRGESLAFVNVAVSTLWWKSFHSLLSTSIPSRWYLSGAVPGCWLLNNRDFQHLSTALVHLEEWHGGPSLETAEILLRVIDCFTKREAADSQASPPGWLKTWRRTLLESGSKVAEPIHYWQQRSGRSSEHLARSCRTYYGMTPTDLINQARIARAKTLLRTTDEKVISIAFSSGFNNLANFYRHFNHFAGMSPTRWRRLASASVPPANP